ncbi:MAG TPA: DNA polymerase III subunit delta' [Candidatus Lachnoclostridium stercoravium]|uniref:DNA polymerase III subunit delta' n=1 Tax=Candidatus Lachnoclostridium stercoravium TaxID=2838633 RepID=A0A9D2HHP9_9FIRM|nr:DNA polymerase III subunit delta' [Candidatus Lachnoclostridium stercoravium]
MPGFQDILGHEGVKEHLINAIDTNKVSHAYIITGEEGMGRKSLAHAFALTLLCEKGGSEPCMKCHACKQVLAGSHPDLIHVTHEKPGSIGVDDIREQIQDTIMIRPYSSYYKIYILDEAEKMTVQAQNALLKTIEEPPSYAVIILLTTNQDIFLPTILSRCVQLKLKPLRDSVVKEYLINTLHVSEHQAAVYAAFARGNLGRAIHIATSEEFQEMYKGMLFLMVHLKNMTISEILDYIKTMIEENMDINECLDFMQLWYRDILMYKVTRDMNLLIFKNEYNSINEMSEKCSYDGFEKILQAIDKARVRLDANVNRDLALELMLLVMKEN